MTDSEAKEILKLYRPGTADADDPAFAEALAGRPTVVGYSLTFDGGDEGALSCGVPSLPLVLTGEEAWGASYFRAANAVCSVAPVSRAAVDQGFASCSPWAALMLSAH